MSKHTFPDLYSTADEDQVDVKKTRCANAKHKLEAAVGRAKWN